MMRYRTAAVFCAIIIALALVACEQTAYRLPPVGGVIYCPYANCPGNDADGLYQRVTGTSRTAFRRSDYVQTRYDCPVPAVGMEHICPLCTRSITTVGADGLLYTHYREVRR